MGLCHIGPLFLFLTLEPGAAQELGSVFFPPFFLPSLSPSVNVHRIPTTPKNYTVATVLMRSRHHGPEAEWFQSLI